MRPEAIVEFAESLARISASGGGPKALAAQLARATGGGVLLEDAQWHHVTAAGSNGVPPSARAVAENGAAGRVLQVRCGDAHVGWLSLFGADDGEGAELLLRLAAAAIGTELGRDATRRLHASSFWDALLAGSFSDATAARQEAAAHGITLAAQYCVVVLEAEAADAGAPAPGLSELKVVATEAFRAGAGELGMCEREQLLFAIVPAARAVDASNARTAATLLPRSAARRKTPLRISGGVGTLEAPADLARSAATAQTALTIARRAFGSGRVVAYDELGAYPLLYEGADGARLRSFAAGVLAPLRAYDQKHQTELERTLKIYFAVGQNIKTASERLNVHRQTIFYRLRQIGEITSRSLEAPHDQLTFRMAIAIDDLHA